MSSDSFSQGSTPEIVSPKGSNHPYNKGAKRRNSIRRVSYKGADRRSTSNILMQSKRQDSRKHKLKASNSVGENGKSSSNKTKLINKWRTQSESEGQSASETSSMSNESKTRRSDGGENGGKSRRRSKKRRGKVKNTYENDIIMFDDNQPTKVIEAADRINRANVKRRCDQAKDEVKEILNRVDLVLNNYYESFSQHENVNEMMGTGGGFEFDIEREKKKWKARNEMNEFVKRSLKKSKNKIALIQELNQWLVQLKQVDEFDEEYLELLKDRTANIDAINKMILVALSNTTTNTKKRKQAQKMTAIFQKVIKAMQDDKTIDWASLEKKLIQAKDLGDMKEWKLPIQKIFFYLDKVEKVTQQESVRKGLHVAKKQFKMLVVAIKKKTDEVFRMEERLSVKEKLLESAIKDKESFKNSVQAYLSLVKALEDDKSSLKQALKGLEEELKNERVEKSKNDMTQLSLSKPSSIKAEELDEIIGDYLIKEEGIEPGRGIFDGKKESQEKNKHDNANKKCKENESFPEKSNTSATTRLSPKEKDLKAVRSFRETVKDVVTHRVTSATKRLSPKDRDLKAVGSFRETAKDVATHRVTSATKRLSPKEKDLKAVRSFRETVKDIVTHRVASATTRLSPKDRDLKAVKSFRETHKDGATHEDNKSNLPKIAVEILEKKVEKLRSELAESQRALNNQKLKITKLETDVREKQLLEGQIETLKINNYKLKEELKNYINAQMKENEIRQDQDNNLRSYEEDTKNESKADRTTTPHLNPSFDAKTPTATKAFEKERRLAQNRPPKRAKKRLIGSLAQKQKTDGAKRALGSPLIQTQLAVEGKKGLGDPVAQKQLPEGTNKDLGDPFVQKKLTKGSKKVLSAPSIQEPLVAEAKTEVCDSQTQRQLTEETKKGLGGKLTQKQPEDGANEGPCDTVTNRELTEETKKGLGGTLAQKQPEDGSNEGPCDTLTNRELTDETKKGIGDTLVQKQVEDGANKGPCDTPTNGELTDGIKKGLADTLTQKQSEDGANEGPRDTSTNREITDETKKELGDTSEQKQPEDGASKEPCDTSKNREITDETKKGLGDALVQKEIKDEASKGPRDTSTNGALTDETKKRMGDSLALKRLKDGARKVLQDILTNRKLTDEKKTLAQKIPEDEAINALHGTLPQRQLTEEGKKSLQETMSQLRLTDGKRKSLRDKMVEHHVHITMKKNYENELQKIRDFLSKERQRHVAENRRNILQYQNNTKAASNESVKLLKSINRFKQSLAKILEKEALKDAALEIKQLEVFPMAGMLSSNNEIKQMLSWVTDHVAKTLLSIEEKVAKAMMVKRQQEKAAANAQQLAINQFDKQQEKLRKQQETAFLNEEKLKKMKEQIYQFSYQHQVLLGKYKLLQKEIETYKDVIASQVILRKEHANEDAMRGKDGPMRGKDDRMEERIEMQMSSVFASQQEIILKASMTEKINRESKKNKENKRRRSMFYISVNAQRNNLRCLDEAFKEDKITSDTYETASTLIKQTMAIPKMRFVHLVERYVDHMKMMMIKQAMNDALTKYTSNSKFLTYTIEMNTRMEEKSRQWDEKKESLIDNREKIIHQLIGQLSTLRHQTGLELMEPRNIFKEYKLAASDKSRRITPDYNYLSLGPMKSSTSGKLLQPEGDAIIPMWQETGIEEVDETITMPKIIDLDINRWKYSSLNIMVKELNEIRQHKISNVKMEKIKVAYASKFTLPPIATLYPEKAEKPERVLKGDSKHT